MIVDKDLFKVKNVKVDKYKEKNFIYVLLCVVWYLYPIDLKETLQGLTTLVRKNLDPSRRDVWGRSLDPVWFPLSESRTPIFPGLHS